MPRYKTTARMSTGGTFTREQRMINRHREQERKQAAVAVPPSAHVPCRMSSVLPEPTSDASDDSDSSSEEDSCPDNYTGSSDYTYSTDSEAEEAAAASTTHHQPVSASTLLRRQKRKERLDYWKRKTEAGEVTYKDTERHRRGILYMQKKINERTADSDRLTKALTASQEANTVLRNQLREQRDRCSKILDKKFKCMQEYADYYEQAERRIRLAERVSSVVEAEPTSTTAALPTA